MNNTTDSKPWLSSYGERPADVQPAFSNMLALFDAAVRANPSADALQYSGQSRTYDWLNERSNELAGWLINRGNVARGARVAIILQNVPEFLISVVATWKCGATPMPLNPMYQERELTLLFSDGAPSVIICHEPHLDVVTSALENSSIAEASILHCPARASNTDVLAPATREAPANLLSFEDACAAFRAYFPPDTELRSGEPGLLLYTSGTTGTPKGAVLSHGALSFNATISVVWFGVRSSGRIVTLAPLFHIVGFLCQVCVAFLSRSALHLNYRFDPRALLSLIQHGHPTFMIGTITAYIALMNQSEVTAAHFSSFDTLYAGGGPVPLAVVEQFKSRFGKRIAVAYGMTETCAPTHVTPYELESPVDSATGSLSIGIPISSSDAMIVSADGSRLEAGEAGELLVKGPMLMDGYLNKPDATAEALRAGWMHTGDVSIMDSNGWFYLIDRKKDVIIASGFKVWPREVEDVLYSHPAIREVAVIGVPDDYRGETVRAYVSLKTDCETVEDALIAYCRERLASYKAPRQIVVLADLPKTITGKIMRAELRKYAALDGAPACPER